jgi:hypothetical protein
MFILMMFQSLFMILGGKDSLVVWQQANANMKIPVLLYCCDTLYEFESNWRIQAVAKQTGCPIILGLIHIFT